MWRLIYIVNILYLKNKLTYKNILKAIVIIATIVIAYNCLTKIAYADGFLSYGNSDDPYKNIPEGWGMFISEKYRNNYAFRYYRYSWLGAYR